MRLIALLIVPALILLTLEGTLRLVGYGYETDFFETVTVDGREHLFVNHQFTRRFFPPALARSPIPQSFPVEKPEGTYRIFVFGESAANGDPDAAYGFGRNLEILLAERFPGTRFEVIVTAITAINSHAILPIARECAQIEADLWIVYMGNNEMVGTFGASTVFGSKAPPLAIARLTLALKTTRLGQLLDALVSKSGGKTAAPETWEGIGMFSQNLLRPDDPARLAVYEHFNDNLSDMLEAAEDAGVPVLLSTVASNLKDCAPFASLPPDDLSASDSARWETLMTEAVAHEGADKPEAALEAYRKAATLYPEHAELQYRLARAEARAGDWAACAQALTRARDYDGLVVRADSRINSIIRDHAARASGVELIDAVKALAALSPRGLPGRNLFFEHVHFTPSGNYRMALLFAEAVMGHLPEPLAEGDTGIWIRPAEVQQRLALSAWDQQRLWLEMQSRLAVPPFTAQITNRGDRAFIASRLERASERLNPANDGRLYAWALTRDPEDYFLRLAHARFLQENERLAEAIEEWQWAVARFPEFEGGHQDLGIALFLAGRHTEAEASFRRVLELRPGYRKAEQALEVLQRDPRFNSGPSSP